MSLVILQQEPATYSAVYNLQGAGMFFVATSTASSDPNFKYIFDTYYLNTFGATTSTLITRSILPPRPNSAGIFTPSRLLSTRVSKDLQPFISGFKTASNSYVRYAVTYGFEEDPQLSFISTSNESGFLGLSFSSAHNLLVNDVILIAKDNNQINPEYNGTTSITSVVSTIGIKTDKVFGVTSSNESGEITDLIRIEGTSSVLYGLNSTRQYSELNVDYINTYLMTHTNSHYLNNWTFNNLNDSKSVFITNYETISLLVDNTLGTFSGIIVSSINQAGTVIQSVTYSYSIVSAFKRADFGVGPMNLTSGPSLTNVWGYTVNAYGTAGIYATMTYQLVSNCSPWTNFRVAWLNRQGGFDYFNFNWKSSNTENVESSIYKKELDYNYTIGDRQDTVLSNKTSETWTISTDFITENEAIWLKQLISSPEVYIIDEVNQLSYPIIVNTKSYTIKTKIMDKLFSFSIDFKYAYDIVIQGE